MLNSSHIQFSAYCHGCDTSIEVMPATADIHCGLALNHSKGYGHTCNLYRIMPV